MSAPRPEKTKPDADQTNTQLTDLNNAGYNRFRALKQGIFVVFTKMYRKSVVMGRN